MKKSFKTKWVLMAGLAMALPVSGVLSGCGGGSGLNLNGGGGGGGTSNAFANVRGSGPLLRNGANIGTVTFEVDANGVITGSFLQAAQNLAARSAAKNIVRAPVVVTSTSNVASNGAFTLTFDVNINGVPQTLTFSGTLAVNGNSASISAVSVTSSVAGDFSINLSVTVNGNGGPNNGSGSFTVSGGNAQGGTIGGTVGTITPARVNGKLTALIFTFSSAGLNGVQTLTLAVNDDNEVTAKNYSIAAEDATAVYVEQPIASQQVKAWEATSGNVQITSLSSTQAAVSVSGLTLSPTSINNNTASGNLTVSGSGTLTIQ